MFLNFVPNRTSLSHFCCWIRKTAREAAFRLSTQAAASATARWLVRHAHDRTARGTAFWGRMRPSLLRCSMVGIIVLEEASMQSNGCFKRVAPLVLFTSSLEFVCGHLWFCSRVAPACTRFGDMFISARKRLAACLPLDAGP